MNQKNRVSLIILVFLSLITLWYAAENLDSDFIGRHFRPHQPSSPSAAIQPVTIVEPTVEPSKQLADKITFIALWQTTNDAAPAQYMPLFFQSVEANPTIDLLFVNIVSDIDNCKPYAAAANIKVRFQNIHLILSNSNTPTHRKYA